jgi:hypothetical protein
LHPRHRLAPWRYGDVVSTLGTIPSCGADFTPQTKGGGPCLGPPPRRRGFDY